ncbi:MAG: DUF937 domain-containing protein [Longimicrobiales bacterium]
MAMIIDMVRAVLTPDVVRGASNTIGEDPSAVQNTLNSAVPSILAGTLHQGSSPSGAERLFTMITDGRFSTDTTSGINRLIGGGAGADAALKSGEGVVSNLFGAGSDRVTDAVANAGGVRRNSASTLLSMVAPIVMSVLARQVASGKLDARGLMSMLTGERDSIVRGLPPGLGRDLGLDRPAVETHRTTTRTVDREPVHYAEPKRERVHKTHERSRMRPLLIGGLAGLALLFFLTRNRDRREERAEAPPATELPTPAPAPAPAPVQPVTPEVPAVAERAAPIGELAVFLTEGSGQTPRNFLLEDVTFQSGSSNLTPASKNTVNTVADVLVAHPNTMVRIEGHTDNQGDAEQNRSLSLARANAVKAAMVARGVGAGQITTKGVGPDQPVASNDTDSGRTQNRRTELIVVQR